MKLEKIKKVCEEKSQILREKFRVRNLEIFGSYARREQKENSDLDVLVEFEEPIDLITFIELENYLSELLGIKVDLVAKSALKSRIRGSILKEAIHL